LEQKLHYHSSEKNERILDFNFQVEVKMGAVKCAQSASVKFSGHVAELANAFVIHPKDTGSNLGIDRKYSLILCKLH
jgi:hypothetical protein